MSLRALWSYLAIGLPVLAALLAPMSTVDLTYQLRAGAEILATGAIPAQDTWTFTVAGTPWFDQQWGAQLILRLVEQLGGWTGLVLVRAGLTATVVGSVFYVARRRGLDARTAALLTLAAFVVAAPAMALRPQLFGLALFGLLLVVIELRHSRPRVLWLAPVIVAVWANVHGSFFIGPLSLGLAWLADVGQRSGTARRTLAVAALGAVAACITPFGPAVWAYAVGLSSNPGVTSLITEWQPTSLRTPVGVLFYASALAVVAVLARRGRATDWPTLLWLAAFFAIGAYAERGVAWWALGGAVAVAGLIEPAEARERTDPVLIRRVNAVTAVAIAVVAVALLPIWRPVDPGTRAPDWAAHGCPVRRHGCPPGRRRPGRPDLQSAALGFVVRVRVSRRTGRRRFEDRALPRDFVERLRIGARGTRGLAGPVGIVGADHSRHIRIGIDLA